MENNKNYSVFKGATVMAQYTNGNYMVLLLNDGTKIRYTNENELKPDYPESIDLCITKKCKKGCLFCFENCIPTGNEAGTNLLSAAFWDDIPPYTEIAINGNDMDWEWLDNFLDMTYNKKLIVNITVTISQFLKNYYLIQQYKSNNMIKGVGISIGDMDDWNINPANTAQLIKLPEALALSDFANTDKHVANILDACDDIVFHSVLGINDYNKIALFANTLKTIGYTKPIKILFLGYKTKGRGIVYQHMFQDNIKNNIEDIKKNYSQLTKLADVLAFDNLAVEQLSLHDEYTESEWCTKYLGNDGLFSMYIDGTTMKFAKNSCIPDNERHDCKDLTLSQIFKIIRKEANGTSD